MVADKLPPGWKVHVKVKNGRKFKYYSKAETGQKFYSKLAVMRYMNMSINGADTTRPQSETDCDHTPHTPINHGKEASVSEAVIDGPDTNRSPLWLPPGWITEVKPRMGSRATYKIYIDPTTGKKFYSQPQVAEYLKALSQKEGPVKNNKDGADTNKSLVGLPPGWITEVKSRSCGSTYKIYINLATGSRFRSLSQVSQYLETLAQKEVPVKMTENTAVGISASETDVYEHQGSVNKGCRSRSEKDVSESGSVDGLPVGWTKEIKIRHYANVIKRDPYYKDPVSGYVFRSKKDALRYLDTGDMSKCSIRPTKGDEPTAVSHEDDNSNELSGHHISRKDRRSISKREVNKVSNYSGEPDQLHNTAVDGLPIGWIREIQIRRDGNGKDSLYIDPISGYMFRSKKDALRYIETGDISKCACKPKQRDANDIGSAKLACGDHACGQHISRKDQSSISQENKINNNSGEPLQSPAEVGLPIGWTKDIQIRKNGIGKDYFYTDPISGYMFRSRIDALRYIETGDISKCANKPKKRDVNDTGSTKQQVSGIKNSVVDGLQIGWTKEIQTRRDGIGEDTFYTDPVSGYMFRSKKDALRYIKTGDTSKCAIKPKKRDGNDTGSTKQVSRDQLNNSAVDGLPIGWIREIQTRRDGIGKDSFYTDPVSGYMFRSKVDALRYIETGDISNCASKPKKRDAVTAGSAKHVDDPLTPVSRRNLPRSSNRQLFIGEQSADSRSSCKRISQSTPGRTSKRLAGCQPEMPNLQASERDLRAAMKMSCEDESNILPMVTMNVFPSGLPQPLYPEPPSVDANPIQKLEFPKKIINKKVSRSTPANSKKSNLRKAPSTPGRTSNIQTDFEYHSPSNLQLSEGSFGAEMRKSSEDEAHVFPWININDVPDIVPQPFHSELSTTTVVGMSSESEPYPVDTEPVPEVADIVSMVVESISNMDAGQKLEEHSAQQINEKQENFKPQDIYGGNQFVDPLPNPFMNFAFNNPTGAAPDEDNVSYRGYSQQQSSNLLVQGKDSSGWSGSQNLRYSRNGIPSKSNSAREEAQVDRLQSHFSFVTPGFGDPSFGSTDSQKAASDNGNNSVFKRNM